MTDTLVPVPAEPWPDRRTPKSPAVGDTVELGTTRYRITAFHQTDDGMIAKLVPVAGMTFVMAHELAWHAGGGQAAGFWAPETEGELREAWGK